MGGDSMATVTIRNLDDAVVRKLKRQAKTNHRSLEAELRALLSEEARKRGQLQAFRQRADRIVAMTPRKRQTDSTLLMREDRGR
jgi:plasmid stability protein